MNLLDPLEKLYLHTQDKNYLQFPWDVFPGFCMSLNCFLYLTENLNSGLNYLFKPKWHNENSATKKSVQRDK